MARRPKPERPELKHLAARVLSLREARGFTTQARFAEACGLSTNQIQRLESGKREPKYLTLLAVARGLRIDPAVVVSDKYLPNVPLIRRQPPVAWKALEEASRFLQTLSAEMAAYEAPMSALPPATQQPPRQRKGRSRRR